MRVLTNPLLCDECGKPINNNSEGMVEWIDDDVSINDVRIIHNPTFSPTGNCFKHTRHFHRQDNHLDFILANVEIKKSLGIF